MTRIGILASGSGSNAEKIMDYFSESSVACVALLASDNPDAFALTRASQRGVPTAVFTRAEFADGSAPLAALYTAGVDYIVLAGFLRLIPFSVIKEYAGRIVNIHPALLPAYGGKGMYGSRVHEAVIAAGERESGITIHRVDEHYDEGAIIAQFSCPVFADDTPDTLAARIHELEHRHFSETIENDIKKLQNETMSREKEKKLRLILRQVADVQLQAKNILNGNKHRATIESFARFCTELNAYIRINDEREDVIKVMNEMPEIQYTLWPNSMWAYFVTPFWIIESRKSVVSSQIKRVLEKYEILESRLRGMNSDMFKS
jgi:phosphoribosylglycinamide formyltransferase-1